ncbi:hypothetical protein HJFPF1_12511 [Paramyrothecium foliicola]|nr:hypothetical protein HJFPF1_12511 [Paramyrothecium foliicola]
MLHRIVRNLPLRFMRRAAAAGAGTAVVGTTSFHFYTRSCYFDEFSPQSDAVFQHHYLRKINPQSNPSFHDCCNVDVSFSQLQPELLADAVSGGSKLVESFSAGTWAGNGFWLQRAILKAVRKSPANSGDLWEDDELQSSTYPEGTILADDFQVVSKTSNSLMFRGGLSPRYKQDLPREFDTIIILSAEIDQDQQLVKFRLKSIVFDGVSNSQSAPMGSVPIFLHQQYAKLLVLSGSSNCLA